MSTYQIEVTIQEARDLEEAARQEDRTPENLIGMIVRDWLYGLRRRSGGASIEGDVPKRLKRRAIKQAQRIEIFRRDNGECQECRGQLRLTDLWHIDHIVSVAAGGTNDAANLRLLCEACNLEKSNK